MKNCYGDEIASYQEHLDFLIRQEAGARAERYGFVDAKMANATAGMPLSRPVPQWSIPIISDYEQMRYKQGYEDGKAILMQMELGHE